jgi:DNA-binding LacI/PurR family transcriptional regulator
VLDGGALNEYGDALIAEVGRATALKLAADPARPSAIVALNDLMALGLMAGLREGGLRVPEDVSVVGIDGHFIAALSNPMLTTVQLPIPEMAQAMVERAVHPHADPDLDPRQAVFAPTQLIERESVTTPATVSRGVRAGRAKGERARA